MIHLLVVSLSLMAAPRELLESANRLEPIGWTKDERTVAFRVFFDETAGDLDPCAGYVDGKGKKFEAGLGIIVVRDDAVLHSFEIQQPPSPGPCTPPTDAKKALEAAKKKLDELGIDRKAPGNQLPVKAEPVKPTGAQGATSYTQQTWRVVNGTDTLELVGTSRDTSEEEFSHTVTGSFAWKYRTAAAEKKGTLELGPTDWSQIGAGRFGWGVLVFASPGGKTLVAFVQTVVSNMRGVSISNELLPLNGKK